MARGEDQHRNPKSNIEIAQEAEMLPIGTIAAEKLGIPDSAIEPYGKYKAKIALDYVRALPDKPNAKLILVTAITPTPAGEGKTTTTVGLGDALNLIGKKAMLCLREASMGPCFGVKGGAAGGGYAQVVPMEDINLHFTGDLHAIGAANNLLAAMVDNHIYYGLEPRLDPRRVTWRRAMDMNDRALRTTISSLGGVANGYPREDGFDITAASQVMATFCLATGLQDLQRRLGQIHVGQTRERKPVTASDVKAAGSMTALLKDALAPNLVQTIEHNPVFIHGGPFANIAHGCNSVIATTSALKLADYVVTEAGFGADLGAEKFIDIKCRKAGLRPSAAVVVTTVRALKMHGGVALNALREENVEALEKGFANLQRHLANIRQFGLPAVVSVNRFSADTPREHARLKELCAAEGVKVIIADHWAQGGAGAVELAREVVDLAESGQAKLNFLYPDEMPLLEKIRTIAQRLYGAADIEAAKSVQDQLAQFQEQGYGNYPVCIAKTQLSFSTDPNLKGAPSGHTIAVREVRLSAGAEFVVAICGDMMTMPGLPRVPAANNIEVDAEGKITGLF
ncbi:MAG TPA: formate--tetrahydrofolate ligase [Stellaceae bacterium]